MSPSGFKFRLPPSSDSPTNCDSPPSSDSPHSFPSLHLHRLPGWFCTRRTSPRRCSATTSRRRRGDAAKSWIDKDTGTACARLGRAEFGAFYFNVNAFTPDHKQMVYNSPDGIRCRPATMTTRMLVPNQSAPPVPLPRMPAAAGRQGARGGGRDLAAERVPLLWAQDNSVFFTRMDP